MSRHHSDVEYSPEETERLVPKEPSPASLRSAPSPAMRARGLQAALLKAPLSHRVRAGEGGPSPRGWVVRVGNGPLFEAQPLTRGGACFLTGGPAASQPLAEAVHVDVDDWCGEQSQQLRHQEAADDCIAERLANFRAHAGAEHQRKT